MAAVSIADLSKTYTVKIGGGPFKRRTRSIEALKNINLTIERGELFGLLGPNGAGKTTLIKCITTLLIPDRGTITVNGFTVGRQNGQVKASLGCMLNGERSVYHTLTGRENLEYFAALYRLSPPDARRQIAWLSRLLNLQPLLERPVETYSSGQKTALAFARALVNRAKILILDEPTNALDVPAAQALRGIIKTLNAQGYTIILTSHQMAEVDALCRRVAIVDRGRIIAQGTVDALKAGLTQNQIIKIEGVIPSAAVEAVKARPDVVQAAVERRGDRTGLTIVVADMRQSLPGLMELLLNHHASLEQISPAAVTLEDVFMAHTGRALSQDTGE
ncbi:MAG: ABC transporter ATP-binding protein [Anaerolineae bacterium]